VNGGKVESRRGVKPAKLVQAGRHGERARRPAGAAGRGARRGRPRGSAAVAQTLYEETAESRARRERAAEQMRLASAGFVYEDKGRPTKRDRRDLERFRDGRRG
jgi:ribosome-associated heat shock protein Hsp15